MLAVLNAWAVSSHMASQLMMQMIALQCFGLACWSKSTFVHESNMTQTDHQNSLFSLFTMSATASAAAADVSGGSIELKPNPIHAGGSVKERYGSLAQRATSCSSSSNTCVHSCSDKPFNAASLTLSLFCVCTPAIGQADARLRTVTRSLTLRMPQQVHPVVGVHPSHGSVW